jgi:CheY-like chemotaxis protein
MSNRIMIVDDNEYVRASVEIICSSAELDLTSAASGTECLGHLESGFKGVILMDIMMPDMDGIAIMREARSLASCRDVPIIAVTAKAMKGDRERCIEAGAWDYLSKPVDSQQLLGVLRAWAYR